MSVPDYLRKINLTRLRASAGLLLHYAFDAPIEDLTNNFIRPKLLKNRIAMLYKNRNSNWALGKYAATALIVGTVSLLAASCGQESKKDAQDTLQTQTPDAKATALSQGNDTERQKIEDRFITNYGSGLDSVYTVVRTNPEFPGGVRALYQFVEKNMRYPESARKARVEGKVFLTFVVNSDGSLQNIEVLKGMGFGTDPEAIRLVKSMPRWNPGVREDGQKVNVKFNLPIGFDLPEEKKEVSLAKPMRTEPVRTEILSDKAEIASIESQNDTNRKVDELVPLKSNQFRSEENLKKGVKVVIRGGGFYGSGQPLIVLDGVASSIEKPTYLEDIDPSNIESISVVKDSAAKAAYGLRGANGVVIITTKKTVKSPIDFKGESRFRY